MAFCSKLGAANSATGNGGPAMGAGMASGGSPAAATASNSFSSSPGSGDPGPGIPLASDGSAPSSQNFYVDKNGQALNGMGGGWRDAINGFVRSKMPAGVQGLLGAAGMAGMPTPGVNGANYPALRGNAPTTLATNGMAIPGSSFNTLTDPGAPKPKTGMGL